MPVFDRKEKRNLTQKEWKAVQAKARREELKENRKAEKEFRRKEGWNDGKRKVRES